jgi:hypothetical protein
MQRHKWPLHVPRMRGVRSCFQRLGNSNTIVASGEDLLWG